MTNLCLKRPASCFLARIFGHDGVYQARAVAGFYTLSAHSIARADVGGGRFVRNAPNQVPVVLLGMLGVDKVYKGRGLGAALLRDAIFNANKISSLAGARALVVDPVDDEAAAFYERFGFIGLPGTVRMALRVG